MKTIEWIPSSKEVERLVPMPKPAREYLPSYYKESAPPSKELTFSSPGNVSSATMKACMPLFDAYTHGYIQEAWTDIHFSTSPDGEYVISYNWADGPAIVGHRETASGFKVNSGFSHTELFWKEAWIPKLPSGYSILYTSPANRFDLPFRSLDAVIDSDKYHHEYFGNYPFFLEKGFNGVIPAGTPLYQLIPIKRDFWEGHATPYNEGLNQVRRHLLRKHFVRGYKNLFWTKKSFK